MQITLTSYLKENTVVKVCHFHWHRIFITFFACVFLKKVLIDFTTVTCPVIKFLLCTEYSTLQKPWMCVFFAEYRLQLKTENNIKNVIIHSEMFCSRPFKICCLILKFALLLLNKQFMAFWFWRYYEITAFDEADIMIYQPWKFDIHWGKWLIYFKMHPKYFWVIIISFRSLSMEWIKQHINVEHIWWYVASHRVLANQKQEI